MSVDSDDDDEDEEKDQKSKNLMKAKQGGVNKGESKAMVNAKAIAGGSTNQKNSNSTTLVGGRSGKKESNEKNTRTKERTITDIIEKVSTWRKLYNGVMVPNPQNTD